MANVENDQSSFGTITQHATPLDRFTEITTNTVFEEADARILDQESAIAKMQEKLAGTPLVFCAIYNCRKHKK